MAAEAKTQRATAKRLFTMSNKQLSKAITSNYDPSVIKGRFGELKEAWGSVMSKNAMFLALKYPDDEEVLEEDEAWLDEIADVFNDAEHRFMEYERKGNAEDTSREGIGKSQKLLEFERSQMEVAISNLETVCNHVDATVETIKDAQAEVKSQLNKCKEAQRTHLLTYGELDDKESVHLLKLQKVCVTVAISADKVIQLKNDSKEITKRTAELKIERMKYPKFSGNIRDYPRFKHDFVKYVTPSIKSGTEAYIMKEMCLKEEALDLIKNVDDDIGEIWERLDDRYGKASKLTDVIMHDIKKLKPVAEGEDKKFLEFVDCIERSYRELKRVDMETEISNSTIVALIEERIPKTIKTMWYLQVSDKQSGVDEKNKFPHLLDFLKKHRRAIEYGSSELRAGKSVEKASVHFAHQEEEIHMAVGEKSRDNNKVHTESISGTQDKNNKESKQVYCWIHQSPSHDILDCKSYRDQDVQERWDLVRDYQVCWCCLRVGHYHYQCFNSRACSKDGCRQAHHPTLHEKREGTNSIMKKVSAYHSKRSTACLLQLMELPAGERSIQKINVMWDGGATVCLITFKKAKELGLIGRNVTIRIIKVGGVKETIESKVYDVPVHDESGVVEYFKVYGIQKISSSIEAVETSMFAVMFGVDPDTIRRPEGEVDVLIGLEYAGFHPDKEKSVDHLVLFANRFGACLGGTHPKLTERTEKVIQDIEVAHIKAAKIDDFYESESLGISCQPKCGNCKCGECPIGGKQYTLQQERELAMIEGNLRIEEERWYVSYPWKRSPTELPNNYSSAFGMLKSTEKRLSKNQELATKYQDQIDDMLARGVARKMPEEEIQEYTGPQYYIAHHEVLSGSESTPCRLVFNSSAKFNGHVLNDYWAKGPDMLNNLLGVLLRFRENKIAISGDIKKMYHAIKIEGVDQQTHRFLWREMNTRKPDTYVMTSLSFGDRPAAAIAAVALKKTAEMAGEEFPNASVTIKNNSYVDDIIDSFDNKAKATEMTEQIDSVLKKGGFEVKKWIVSGQPVEDEMQVCSTKSNGDERKTTSTVLGVIWDVSRDQLRYKVKLNFSQRHRKVRLESDVEEDELLEKLPEVLTKRILLSQVNGVHDPLGLATPFTVKAKILLRRLNELMLDWDDSIPPEEREPWVQFFVELFEMEDIRFARSTKPDGAKGQPILIIFSDASEQAFGACAYIRWELEEGGFESRLLLAKSRLAPLKKITTVRLELNAALLSARLKEFIHKEISYSFARTYLIVDSEIVRAMTQRDSYGFNTFVAVRIGEIQEKTEKDEWYWVEGGLNIADIISRGTKPAGLMGEWQSGPKFLMETEENWPTKQGMNESVLPEQVVMKMKACEEVRGVDQVINIQNFSSYDKLIRVTARARSMFQKIPQAGLKNACRFPDRQQLAEAEMLWIRSSQVELEDNIPEHTYKRLGTQLINGIIVIGSRMESWRECTYNNENPILLSAKSGFAKLYASKIHDEAHLGVSATAAKIRAKYWIVGLRKLLRSIKFRCVICKKLGHELQKQCMGQLPAYRLKPAPAWSYTGLDLFGPFDIKGEANKRSRSKGYGVIFTCMLSRAVHLDISTSYDTESFLLVLRRFIAIRGSPLKFWSDQGSQLQSANKEMQQAMANLNRKLLVEFGVVNHIDWDFGPPDAPWQNGCTESLIKSVKKSLTVVIGEQALTFSEMQTVLFEVASLINERPIGRHPTMVDDGVYLSPNDLLLARSNNKIPAGPFNLTTNKYVRHRFVQKITEAFWCKWTEEFFPSLIVQQKWHTQHRNVKVGDVVLVQDSGMIKGKWRLGKVIKADASPRDGFVRKVDIQYKNPDAKSFITITRAVQRIVVIVPIDEDDEPAE